MTGHESISHSPSRLAARIWLVIVLAVGLLTRLALVFLYQPVAYSDTSSYRRLAERVLQGFTNYDGTRTPGYPIFLALLGTDQRVWLAQLFLGLVATLLLFYIGWKLTGKPWFGGLVAVTHTLDLGQLFFESNLLTESLTTFFVVCTMAVALVWLFYPAKRTLALGFCLGLLSTITLLVRPLFIYLPALLLFFMVFIFPHLESPLSQENTPSTNKQETPASRHEFHWQHGVAFALPVILLVGVWVAFIHSNFGDWSLTTMSGYHLVQHTGSFFEYVPNEYSALRDTYIHYRDIHIAQNGTQTNTIWEAIPEMERVSGYNFYDLSRVLARISIQLIMKHPLLFIKSAVSGWWMFWRTPFYWSADAVRYPWLAAGINFVVQIQRMVLFLINLIFIIASLFFILSELIALFRPRLSNLRVNFSDRLHRTYFWLLLSTIWVASILQTLLDHGDNPRFLVPLQSVVILWVALFIYHLVFANRAPIHSKSGLVG